MSSGVARGARAIGARGLLLAAVAAASEPPPWRIASDATYPPVPFLEGSTATGFDLELARLVAERAGFRPVVLVRPYDDLLPGLAAGAHDLVAATTGVTPEREKLYLFTRTVFETCQAALVRAGSKEPTSIDDLRGRRVGASGEGTSARALRGIAGVARVTLGKGEAGVPSLERGDIDALVVDEWSAVASARASKGRLRVLPQAVALERYAFVLPLHRADWKRALDDALAGLESEGRVRALRLRFGLERGGDWPVTLARPEGD